MQLFVYDTNELTEFEKIKVEAIQECVDLSKDNWLNIHGLNDIDIIKKIGDFLNVDSFMLGDILNTTKRTKLDEYHDVLFFNIKSILPEENSNNIKLNKLVFY